jgi:hypothetical protein
MNRSPRLLLTAICALSVLMFACVGVQDQSTKPKQEEKSKPVEDSGFTVSETTVPTTPETPTTGGDGFTVGETAVPAP